MTKLTSRTIELRRVVVTGVGLICSTGSNTSEAWDNVRNGRSGTDRISRFDASEFASQVAGEVKGYDPLNYFDRKEVRKYDPYIQFALIAAKEAVEDSGLKIESPKDERYGCYIGSGIGGISTLEANNKVLLEKGPSRVSPFFLPATIANLATGHVSIQHSLKGPNLASVTACAASTHAIGASFKLIQTGEADVMVTGGAEYPITPLGVAGFSVMRAVTTRNDDPKTASRPFDKERDGFIIAEGGSVLVLESLEHALARGARIYAELVGFGQTGDAFHMTAPDEAAGGTSRCMKNALDDAGIKPEQVDYINAHGTSTPLNDKLETKAIKIVFGDYASKLAISSTKSMTGHMLGATGAAEAIFCVKSLQEQFIPPTINYSVPDEECDLDYVPNVGRSAKIEYALSNSFGFGGTNGTLVFKRYQE